MTLRGFMENNKKTKYQIVKNFTASRIYAIIKNSDDGARRAILAKLRAGVGRSPAECPELWGYYLEKMPEEIAGKNQISYAEMSVYSALTLFALHQQGKSPDESPMFVRGKGIGSAIAALIKNDDDKTRITRRFNMLASVSDFESAVQQVRSMIGMLNSENIPVDYADLAGDFYRMQFSDSIDDVRMKWGKQFYLGFETYKKNDNSKTDVKKHSKEK